jgi:Spy/CpxP family protein refolding chaperone
MRLSMRLTPLFSLLTGAYLLTVVPTMPVQAQESEPVTVQRHERLMALNLTPEQQSQIKQINQSTHAQIQAILTAKQQAQFKAAREQREKPNQIWADLNLSPDQKAKIREIRRTSKQRLEAVLTPEQLEKLHQIRQARRANKN